MPAEMTTQTKIITVESLQSAMSICNDINCLSDRTQYLTEMFNKTKSNRDEFQERGVFFL